ncbi:DNA-binding transcriptional regulator [Chromatiales bacterium (ex Bugula neritina AB1)]|nr:DNA-binding transcriptional regulator [Chromatiales bacterium (ex Bugula neritina AB1)]
MAARAAWLHYAGGFSQAEVAKRLGLNNLKAHRLISKANKEGLVKIYIDGSIGECIALETELCARHTLQSCHVVPDIDDADLPLRSLGIAGAQTIKLELENKCRSIGIGHGRTLAACIDNLPHKATPDTHYVSLLGGLTRKFLASPHDVIHRLADRTSAEAYVMPVPFIANSREDREILLGQRGISEVFEIARSTELKLVGIGSINNEASLVSTGMVEAEELEIVKSAGGVGEILGHFFDHAGAAVATELSERAITLSLDDLRSSRIIAVAGGKHKTEAIHSILESHLLSGLVTDESTARALISPPA